ncbi:MAG: small multi-drug export protein [Methanocellales archaeon]|nr:small multi-drug export protein [Methanocellales archaeon]MDD3291567.1 small multi-drug export protein [Methanocellales archaeon]MDD5235857.1 small multi-drug export protein [Methanocellales archaeon]MDD5485350.1 small multi-drug export protein [Methanocellales archaeon]
MDLIKLSKRKEYFVEKSEYAWLTLAKFFAPFGIAGIVALLIIWTDSFEFGGVVLSYFFPPTSLLGRLWAIPFGLRLGLSLWEAMIAVVFVDLITSLFMVLNFDIALKIPFLGKLISKAERQGREYLKKYPFISRLAFLGIALFIALPFNGTNAVIGSIIGRIIGMKPWYAWSAVAMGSVLGCLLVAIPVYGAYLAIPGS